MKHIIDYHFFYYKPRYFDSLFEVSYEFSGIVQQEDLLSEDFDKIQFEKDQVKDLKTNTKNKTYRHYICALDTEFVGFIFFGQEEHNQKEGFVAELYVRPEHRRKGIATELFEEAIQWLKEVNCSAVSLNVEVDNKTALRFYKKLGFLKQEPKLVTLSLDLKGL